MVQRLIGRSQQFSTPSWLISHYPVIIIFINQIILPSFTLKFQCHICLNFSLLRRPMIQLSTWKNFNEVSLCQNRSLLLHTEYDGCWCHVWLHTGATMPCNAPYVHKNLHRRSNFFLCLSWPDAKTSNLDIYLILEI